MNTPKIPAVAIIFTMMIIIGCNSPDAPLPPNNTNTVKNDSLPKDSTHIVKLNYQPRLTVAKAWYGDTITIFGKNFGNRTTRVAVYLDEILIAPLRVNDTAIRFIIPVNIPKHLYGVTVKILDDEVRNFANLDVTLPAWGDFTTAEFEAKIYCYYYNEPINVPIPADSNSYLFKEKISTVGSTTQFSDYIKDGKIFIDYNGIVSESHNEYKSSESWARGHKFQAEIDTASKTIINIKFTYIEEYSRSAVASIPVYTKYERTYQISAVHYTEIENGIQVVIPTTNLQLALTKFLNEMGPSGTPSRYILKPPFKEDNYIKIKLLRE